MLACYLWSHECNNFLVDDSFKDFGYNWEKRDGPKVFYKMGVALLWDWADLWTFQWGGKVCEDRLELKMCVTDLVRAVAQHLRVDAFILSWPGDFVVSSEVRVSYTSDSSIEIELS